MADLEERVSNIEERNKNVEADKAWETSWSRRIIIALFTYVVVGIFLSAIAVPDAWVGSLVPAIGFVLSTLSIPYFKKVWITKYRK